MFFAAYQLLSKVAQWEESNKNDYVYEEKDCLGSDSTYKRFDAGLAFGIDMTFCLIYAGVNMVWN